MAKTYIIIPLILLGIFTFFYRNFSAENELQMAAKAAAEAAAIEQEAAAKAEAERISREDAARRTAEREADEAAKIAQRRVAWEADGAKVAADTANAKAKSDEHQTRINELELQLAALRQERETLNNEAFAMMKEVEAARIAKRNAELQVQRMAQMVSQKAENSVLVKAPILPPPPPSR